MSYLTEQKLLRCTSDLDTFFVPGVYSVNDLTRDADYKIGNDHGDPYSDMLQVSILCKQVYYRNPDSKQSARGKYHCNECISGAVEQSHQIVEPTHAKTRKNREVCIDQSFMNKLFRRVFDKYPDCIPL